MRRTLIGVTAAMAALAAAPALAQSPQVWVLHTGDGFGQGRCSYVIRLTTDSRDPLEEVAVALRVVGEDGSVVFADQAYPDPLGTTLDLWTAIDISFDTDCAVAPAGIEITAASAVVAGQRENILGWIVPYQPVPIAVAR